MLTCLASIYPASSFWLRECCPCVGICPIRLTWGVLSRGWYQHLKLISSCSEQSGMGYVGTTVTVMCKCLNGPPRPDLPGALGTRVLPTQPRKQEQGSSPLEPCCGKERLLHGMAWQGQNQSMPPGLTGPGRRAGLAVLMLAYMGPGSLSCGLRDLRAVARMSSRATPHPMPQEPKRQSAEEWSPKAL